MRHRTRLTCAALAIGHAFAATSVLAQSKFGCSGLEANRELPAIEGKGGIFYRINADIRMNHPFSQTIVNNMAELSRALESRGTTLIFAPIPTKSVSMPDHLPDEARLYGFDLNVANAVHDDVLKRLTDAGVLTADIRRALLAADPGQLPFFNSDFHWSAYGANLGAAAIADVIKAQPIYDSLPVTRFETEPVAEETAFSGMRRILQTRCTDTLPEPVSMTWDTQPVSDESGLDIGLDIGLSDNDAAGLDIFGEATDAIPIALVGTSFSDSPINNFPNWIAQHASLEVVNFSITGGNQYGAITSYLTSTEFQDAPPAFLVWENPIYNNLAQYGDQPLRELIAAAANNCPAERAITMAKDGMSATADVSGLGASDTLFLDTDGSAALEVDYTFAAANGGARIKSLRRGERLRRTGRFYMPMTGLWPDGAQQVRINLSAPFGPDARLYICNPLPHQEEKS
ncbi:hypothetical protein [Loktanella salsilacus]|uniref:alginate O-acetyltransferase AlgX-related protein n=1 Tax=Loktanella salsilacus TaxID=195913 RepID=UPI0037361E0C